MTRTSQPVGTVIPARFPNLCRNCRHGYQRGDLIRKAADRVWVHHTCPNGQPLPSATVTPAVNGFHDIGPGSRNRPRRAGGAYPLRRRGRGPGADDADVDRIVGKTKAEMLVQGDGQTTSSKSDFASGDTTVIDGKAHAALPRCVRLAAARRNILLIGPAGSGKTHLAARWRRPWACRSLTSHVPRG